ncbi:hypothetical protein DAT35_29140 [Vitiosangium sp. GDMCC 1.1324]|nr:hypothetical protein DAT35_29140 [Vitiosangium sp. GDMCC 1.1324]
MEAAGIEPDAGGFRPERSREVESGFRRSSSRLHRPLPHAELCCVTGVLAPKDFLFEMRKVK